MLRTSAWQKPLSPAFLRQLTEKKLDSSPPASGKLEGTTVIKTFWILMKNLGSQHDVFKSAFSAQERLLMFHSEAGASEWPCIRNDCF
jgi:hypothetical protein